MRLDERTAVVDNDFISHLAESRMTDERLIDVLNLVFCDMELAAAMHPLVYEYELLKDQKRISLLFSENLIYKANFTDIIQDDPDKKAYYIYLLKSLYHSLTGEKFPIPDEDIFTSWIRRKSLGEVHSIVMCLICGCGIFLSDDDDSKVLKMHMERMLIGTVAVYSRDEFIHIHMEKGKTKLNRKERQTLTHAPSR